MKNKILLLFLLLPILLFGVTENNYDIDSASGFYPLSEKSLTVGKNVIVGGDFGSSSGWTLSNATISGGELHINSSTDLENVCTRNDESPEFIRYNYYAVKYTITSYTSGSIHVRVGSSANLTAEKSSTGTFSEIVELTGLPTYISGFVASDVSGFVGTVDNLEIREIDKGLLDLSGNLNNGTSANAPVFVEDQNGVSGQAMSLNGSSDYVTIASDDFGINDWTIACWVKTSGGILDSERQNPIAKDGDIQPLRINSRDSGGTLASYVRDSNGNTRSISGTIRIDNGEWHYIVISVDYDGASIIYVDGIQDGIISTTVWNGTIDSPDYIGKYGLGRYFSGFISDTYINDSEAKSAEWVAEQYLAGQSTAEVVVDGSNLYTSLNATNISNETDTTTDWTVSGATATSDATEHKFGFYSIKGVADDGSSDRINTSFTAVIGKKYLVSIWAKRGSQGTRQAFASWTGCTIATTYITSTSWEQYDFEITATGTTVGIRCYVALSAGGANDVVYVDGISVTDITNQRLTPPAPICDIPLHEPFTGDGTVLDISVYINYGTVDGATVTDSSSVFDDTNDLITIGDIGTAKTLSFWINPDALSDDILEETAGVGISINSGTILYPSWDNCYVDNVDTDTITTGWHYITLTSITDVTLSAFRLGLITASYYGGELAKVRAWNSSLSETWRTYFYNEFKGTYQ